MVKLMASETYGSPGPGGRRMESVRGYFNYHQGEAWAPNVNLYETQFTYVVCVDLAGVDKDKIDLQLLERKLTVRGSRLVPLQEGMQDDAQRKRVKVHLMEIDHGAFSREVELPPDVARAEVTANYRNGMLWIELPKQT